MLTWVLLGLLLLSTIVLSRWVPHHPRWRPLVIALSLFVSARYLWWRATETLNWEGGWGTAVSIVTLLAELYGFLVVLHHYTIATRSLDRTSTPPDADFSPSVDILVSSLNEGADILTRTLIGCQAITYENKQVYLLDDGRRPAIEALCRELGVNYIKRENNKGAKAGNLNNGLEHTTGDFIVTFDADHVPVSSFLTETLGHFRDSKVAQVQTPQHFYNPDLFQGRLRSQEYIANEQDMFYHVVQPGRDVDNASFYCGSGAIFRRAALKEIGGFPMTTVTEDLHTSMILHSRGWQSVYVNKDLSAGLAPESFEGYVTQRRRWARGTMQVMFLRGGLRLPGLTVRQRIHYFFTLWYWMYGLPRIVYLTAPLMFLLLGLSPLLVRDLMDLVSYYGAHLLVSITAFQLVNRGMRRLFWSDIYESCISVQMALTALLFPFTARRVHFAVTPKGQDAERRAKRGSWALGWPILVLSFLMIAGLIKGAFVLASGITGNESTLINVLWTIYNLVLMFYGLLLLGMQSQRRLSPRLPRSHFCKLSWHDVEVESKTIDLSESGVLVRLSKTQPLPQHLTLTIVSSHGRQVRVRGRLIRSEVQEKEFTAAFTFVNRTPEQHRTLVELMYSEPDSWNVAHGLTMGSPEHLRRILRSLIDIFSPARALRRLSPRFACDLPAVMTDSDGRELMVRVVDIGYTGMGVSVHDKHVPPVGTETIVTVGWNDYERTTFHVKVINVRAEGGQSLLGLAFAVLDERHTRDLLKHLDTDGIARAERKAA